MAPLEYGDESRTRVHGLVEAHLNDLAHDLGPTAFTSLLREVDSDRTRLLGLVADAVYRHGLTGDVVGDDLRAVAPRWRPEASGGFETDAVVRSAIRPVGDLDEEYDVVVVGSGAGGGAAAREFAAAGWRVLLVERGSFPDRDALMDDHTRSPRGSTGLFSFAGPGANDSEVRSVPIREGFTQVRANDPRWNNNAMTLGGGTRLYGAQAWRFTAEDLAMASTYGTVEGSALADWPIALDDLAPFYREVEAGLGLAGQGGSASGPWLLPALRGSRLGHLLQTAAERLGWEPDPVPLLINSRPHAGRGACIRCSQCVGFECPVNARAGSHNTTIPAAVATGNLTIATGVQVTRVITESARSRVSVPSSLAVGVRLSTAVGGEVRTRSISCRAVALGAGAIETARLLLESASDQSPEGLGNETDQVGRHLQGHVYGGASALFDEPVVDLIGPGPDIALTWCRHHNPGHVGGGMLADEFVPTPANLVKYLLASGLVDSEERIGSHVMERSMLRFARVMGPVQEMTMSSSRARLDRSTRDVHGRAIVELSGSLHPEDFRTQRFLATTAAQWLSAAGARRVVPMVTPTVGVPAPSAGQHQAGTCRMGNDPATSVTDPMGRLWNTPNVLVVDASTHVTNGGVNPVLTVLANSTRISRAFAAS